MKLSNLRNLIVFRFLITIGTISTILLLILFGSIE